MGESFYQVRFKEFSKEEIMQRYQKHYDTPIGSIVIVEEEGAIVRLEIDKQSREQDMETPLIQETYKQLREYFEGQRKQFTIPIKLQGTVFQNKVWEALQTIPYGTTCSYKDIAVKIGNPKAVRAIGGANHKNQIMIIVPCHRVIEASGGIGGFGAGVMTKQYLLEMEASNQNNTVSSQSKN